MAGLGLRPWSCASRLSASSTLRSHSGSNQVGPYGEPEEYCAQQEKANRLYDELREMLPEAGRVALRAYSDASGAAHYLEVAVPAERAFLDGVGLVLRAMG